MPKKTDWGWVAGLLEGEGYFHVDTRPTKRAARIQINQTDEDIVLTMFEFTGVGSVKGPFHSGNPNHNPYWIWQVGKRADVKPVLEQIRPYMCERRSARIDEILNMYREIELEEASFQHGTRRGYEFKGCRCSKCSNYNNERAQRHRNRHKPSRVEVSCLSCRRGFTEQGLKTHYTRVHSEN